MANERVKRCFLALALDEVAEADFADFMDGLEVSGMRATPIENLHVTVKFLGDVPIPDIGPLMSALTEAIADVPAFDVSVEKLEYLPEGRRPRALCAACSCPEALTDLFNRIEDVTFAAGFRREGRRYHPHITLGRFKKPPRDIPTTDEFEFAPTDFHVNSLRFVESMLDPRGVSYVELASIPLAS